MTNCDKASRHHWDLVAGYRAHSMLRLAFNYGEYWESNKTENWIAKFIVIHSSVCVEWNFLGDILTVSENEALERACLPSCLPVGWLVSRRGIVRQDVVHLMDTIQVCRLLVLIAFGSSHMHPLDRVSRL